MAEERTCPECRGRGWVPLSLVVHWPMRIEYGSGNGPVRICIPCPTGCWKPREEKPDAEDKD